MEEGEERKGIHNLSLKIQTIYSHGFSMGSWETAEHRWDFSALAGENAKREFIGLKGNSLPNPSPPLPQREVILFSSTPSSTRGQQSGCVHSFKEMTFPTFTQKKPGRAESLNQIGATEFLCLGRVPN